jgi:hypothetical protein
MPPRGQWAWLRIYGQQTRIHGLLRSARGHRRLLRAHLLSQADGKVLVVPRKATFDHQALAGLLAKQHGVIARSQVLTCGMSPSVLRHRIRAGG